MKIQCSCGAKYAFEVTPEQVRQPVKFICPACGYDGSDFVNQLIRQQFEPAAAGVTTAMAPPIEVAPAPAVTATAGVPVEEVSAPAPAESASGAQARPAALQVRLHQSGEKARESAPTRSDPRHCPKHPGQNTVEKCFVCGKPICPKCMYLFGYLCSATCKGKADLQGIAVPVYAGQRALIERRHWRRVGLVTGAAGAVMAAFLGGWVWYAWFGSRPSTAYSVRFPKPAYAGAVRLCATNQIVFLHGGTLARHDLKEKREIWSRELIDKQQLEREAENEVKVLRRQKSKVEEEEPDSEIKIPTADRLAAWAERSAVDSLELRVHGQNIWVAAPERIVRYDWDSGKPVQEIPLTNHFGELIARGDEWLLLDERPGRQVITHLNLATGTSHDEEIALPLRAGTRTMAKAGGASSRGTGGRELAGMPTGPAGRDAGKALDPSKVSEQASHMSLPGKLALPAVLSISRNQERALAEMKDHPPKTAKKPTEVGPVENFWLIPAKDSCVQFAVRLIEERMVERKAMKDAPKKSTLERAPSVANTLEIANEILNEIQRDRGGDTVVEDESRYRVTIRIPGAKDVADWSAEVIGPPALFPLVTVNVLTAGKSVVVLDKQNKKLWDSTLNYPLSAHSSFGGEEASEGLGPCVERGNRLYIFDQGVLTAFDLKTGNAQWRLPSVGIAGLFFDEKGMMYVNTTTASHESLKYSRQIDVTDKTMSSVMKVDPKTGKTLWATQTVGTISYISGKFIYAVESYRPFDEDDESPYKVKTGFERQAYVQIKRINARNGQEMWTHREERAPLDMQFDRNSIQIVFKKEVEVLKFLSF